MLRNFKGTFRIRVSDILAKMDVATRALFDRKGAVRTKANGSPKKRWDVPTTSLTAVNEAIASAISQYVDWPYTGPKIDYRYGEVSVAIPFLFSTVLRIKCARQTYSRRYKKKLQSVLITPPPPFIGDQCWVRSSDLQNTLSPTYLRRWRAYETTYINSKRS